MTSGLLSATQAPSETGSTPKCKNFFPTAGANSFPSQYIPFQKGGKTVLTESIGVYHH